jgi:hypothetical protein
MKKISDITVINTVPNNNPALRVILINEERESERVGEYDLKLEPIAAFLSILREAKEEFIMPDVTVIPVPVTTPNDLSGLTIVYDTETDMWYGPDHESGKGFRTLLAYINKS